MRLGIDVDDVLADFVNEHSKISRDLFGVPAPGTLPVDWDMSNYGMNKAEHDAVWRRIKNTSDFWLRLRPKEDTNLLNDLVKEHEVYFITSRVPTKGDSISIQTALWLERHFYLNCPTVIVSHNKGELAKALKLDAFIDDRIENCESVRRTSPETEVFLKRSSHNRHRDHAFIEVDNLNEFAALVGGMKFAKEVAIV